MKRSLHSAHGLHAFPYYWQVPAETEKATYEAVHSGGLPKDFEYVGFPWATVIDGLRARSKTVPEILMALGLVPKRTDPGIRRATVAQHIHAMQFIELFKAADITDIFWSHAVHNEVAVSGISLHPFPLFPAQAASVFPPEEPVLKRKYLANFIGAYSPGLYLTNVRQAIFEDKDKFPDVLIIKRDAWHFDRAVYQEQIKGLAPDEQRLLIEKKHAEEYVEAICDSWFTLCPSGSGPNSIRIFESINLGSIPIILTKTLKLPGLMKLWENAAIIEDDSIPGYLRAIEKARATTARERYGYLVAGRTLAREMSPSSYCKIVTSELTK